MHNADRDSLITLFFWISKNIFFFLGVRHTHDVYTPGFRSIFDLFSDGSRPKTALVAGWLNEPLVSTFIHYVK